MEVAEQAHIPLLQRVYDLLLTPERVSKLIELTIIFSIRLIVAILIFFLLRKLVDILLKRTEKLNSKSKNKSVVTFSRSILRLTLNFIIIMIVLMVMGVKGTAFAGLLGGAGLGIGLAMKDTLSNFAGGMILIIFKAYDVGDFVEIDGQRGEVTGISVFATTMNTRDNKRIQIPNGLVTNTHIINYTRNKVRRVDILFGIAYEADFRQAVEILTKVAENHPMIYKTIEKTIRLKELGDSSVNITFRVWCKADNYWDVYYDVMEEVKTRFDEEGISIPFPQMDVHVKTPPSEGSPLDREPK